MTLLPRVAQLQLDADGPAASWLFVFLGVGLTCSSLALASVRRLSNAGGWFTCALMTSSTFAIIIGFSHSYLLTALLLALTGLSAGVFSNLNLTLIQSYTPQPVMGRVMAIFTLIMLGGTPVGGLLGRSWGSVAGGGTLVLHLRRGERGGGGVLPADQSGTAADALPPGSARGGPG